MSRSSPRLKPICPQGILVSIYKSLILPHLDYCNVVWGNISAGLGQKLEKLQNRAAGIITGTGWDVRSPQILRDLNWMSLADRRANQLKKVNVQNSEQASTRIYIREICLYTNSIHGHNMRGSQHNLFIPRPYTEAFKKSFWYRGAVLWNSLSVETKQATSLNNFLNSIN